jgi:hypothetical protein
LSKQPSVLPEQFADLEPYISWGLPTEAERIEMRYRSSDEELKTFYDAMLPRLHQIAAYLNQLPLNQMPSDGALLFTMAKALIEMSNTVEKGRSNIAWGFEAKRFVPMHVD